MICRDKKCYGLQVGGLCDTDHGSRSSLCATDHGVGVVCVPQTTGVT